MKLYALLIFILLFAISCSKEPPPDPIDSDLNFERINVIDNPTVNGMYDPSIEYNHDGSVGYLVYSALKNVDYDKGLNVDSTYLES